MKVLLKSLDATFPKNFKANMHKLIFNINKKIISFNMISTQEGNIVLI